MRLAGNNATFIRKAKRSLHQFLALILMVSTLSAISVVKAPEAAALTDANCAPSVTGFTVGSSVTAVADSNDCVITFKSGTGNWTPPSGVSLVQILVVAGGGGGGSRHAGGGGAGGVLYVTNYKVTGGSPLSLGVGAGGQGATAGGRPYVGSDSYFGSSTSAILAKGGGVGAGSGWEAGTGGSSGGNNTRTAFNATATPGSTGGTSRTSGTHQWDVNSVTATVYAYGNKGGVGLDNNSSTSCVGVNSSNTGWCGGGGGGAGVSAVGGVPALESGSRYKAGNGGSGVSNSITGTAVTYGGGGGGASGGDVVYASTEACVSNSALPGNGGSGGGGDGGACATAASDGLANTGGGGGGGGLYYVTGNPNSSGSGGSGGSGVVIVRHAFPPDAPQISSVTSGNQSLSVAFTPPTSNGATITGYEYSINSGTNWTTTGGTTSPFTIPSLTNGTAYTVLLRAITLNGASTSPASTGVAGTPLANCSPASKVSSGGFTTETYTTVTTCNWSVPAGVTSADVLVVAGGGGGGIGGPTETGYQGGGGGAGGFIENLGVALNQTAYRIQVGAGGAPANNGINSVALGITATGGGAGAQGGGAGGSGASGSNGGSGGGGGWQRNRGGTGIAGQGFAGATASGDDAGGGGGAGEAGDTDGAGHGGDGKQSVITGLIYAGGGTGHATNQNALGTGVAGTGGGGTTKASWNGNCTSTCNGSANTGGGGAGAYSLSNNSLHAGSGGSGVVVIRYANPTRTITYALNSGTGTAPTQTAVSDGATFVVASGTGLSRDGFTFGGWNDGSNDYAAGSTYTVGASAINLSAIWISNSRTITFNANDGSGSPSTATQTVTSGVSATLRTNTFTRSGYEFLGWTTNANGSGTTYLDQASFTTTTSPTLYASWFLNTDLIAEWGSSSFTSSSGAWNPMVGSINVQRTNSAGAITSWTASTSIAPSYVSGSSTSELFVTTASMHTLFPSSSVSIFTWAYPLATNHSVIQERNNGSFATNPTTHQTIIEMVSGIYNFTLPGCTPIAASSSTSINAWHHVGLTYDGTTLKGFVDGVEVASGACTRTMPSLNLFYGLGGNDGNDMNPSMSVKGDCRVSSLQIFKTSISALKVQNLYLYSIVTFKSNFSGGAADSTQKVLNGANSNLASNTFTRTTIPFIRWSVTASITNSSYLDATQINLRGNLLLYAKWGYTITYKPGNFSTGSDQIEFKDYQANTSVSNSTTMFSRPGYSITAWSLNADGSTSDYARNGSYTTDANLVLYPVWLGSTYTITYSYNSATGGNTDVSGSYINGGTALTLPVPTRTGYSFAGWFEASNLSGAALGLTYSPTQTRTIYAKWSLETYTVTFTVGASGSGSNQTLTKTNSTALSLPNSASANSYFTRSGYTVTGWTTTDASAQTHALGGSFTTEAATTFYPVWSPVSVTITTPSSGLTGTVGSSYSLSLSKSGGSGSGTFSIASGSLPGGLSLNGATGAISGTPTAAGTFASTITFTDTNTATATTSSFSLTISSTKLATPALLDASTVSGAATAITVTFSAVTNASSYTVQLFDSGGSKIGSDYTSFTSGSRISGLTAGTSYSVKILAKGDGTNYTDSDLSTAASVTTLAANFLSFAGATGQYASTTNSVIPTSGNFTVEAWIAPTEYSGTRDVPTIISQGSGLNRIYIKLVSTGILTVLQDGGTAEIACSNSAIPLNKWTHIAVVKSSNTLSCYVNGTLQNNSPTSTLGSSTIGSGFYVGGYSAGQTATRSLFAGQIDEVKIWSAARTQSQIQTNMEVAPELSSANLVAYIPFDATTGTIAIDLKNELNNLTLASTMSWLPLIRTITYGAGTSGSGTSASQTGLSDHTTAITLKSTANASGITRSGFLISAWNTNSGGTSGTSFALSGTYLGTTDLTLYPTWQADVVAPTIGTQPTAAAKTVGQSVTFTVAASKTDAGTLSYQWQKLISSSWTNIDSATSATYTFTTTATSNAGDYRVVVTNTLSGSIATATSNIVALTMSGALSISTPSGLGLQGSHNTAFTSLALVSSGGAGTNTFSATGSLPTGVTLSSAGVISGTPSTAGNFSLTVTVTDANGATATTSSFTIAIAKGASTVALSIPSFTFTGSPQGPDSVTKTGSTGSVTYAYAGRAGTSYASSSTKPTNVGTYSVTATVAADDNYASVSASGDFAITNASLVITPTISASSMAFGTSSGLPTISYSKNPNVTLTTNPTCALYLASDSSYATTQTIGSTLAVGSYVVRCTGAALTNYTVSYGTNPSFSVTKANQASISLPVISATSKTFPYSQTSLSVTSVTGGSGDGALSISSVADGTATGCTWSGSTLTSSSSGTCTLTITKAASASYEAATTTATFTFNKATPTFNSWSNLIKMYSDTFTVTAPVVVGSIPGTFTYSSATTSVISVSGSTLSADGVGSSVITATFTPTSTTDYNTATKTMTVTVNRAYQTMVWDPTTSLLMTDTPVTLVAATALDSAVITYQVQGAFNTSCTINSSTRVLSFTGAGTCTVMAQAAQTDRFILTSISKTFTITLATRTLTIDSGSFTASYGMAATAPTITSTASAGTGTKNYTSSTTSVCTINSSTGLVAFVAPGTCTIGASIAASSSHSSATASTISFTITSSDATLSGLALSTGTLSSSFASATTSYTASVLYATSSITVTPTRTQSDATITVNGTTVSSGSASGSISLTVGANTITVIGTAQDGVTTKTYTVTVTRAAEVLTVTFNANDGSGTPATSMQSISSGVQTALTANAFTRTGYTFAGWDAAADGSGTDYTNSQQVTITSGMTLFAQWTAGTNTVVFNNNTGSGTIANQSITSGTATALTANTFTKTGYTFAGWNTNANGTSGTNYTNSQSVTITAGMTLYAKWTANTNTVTFNANDGSGSPATSTQSIVSGTATGLTSNAFTRTGYTFSGWNTNADGTSGTHYGNGQSVTITSGATLFAKWVPIVNGSLLFGGNSNSYLTIPNSSALKFGTADFTIEWWQYQTDSNLYPIIFSASNSQSQFSPGVSIEANVFYLFRDGGNAVCRANLGTGAKNAWMHLAISRSSGTTKVFRDGNQLCSFADSTDYQPTSALSIGYRSSGSFAGNITNFHWVNGTALYTSAFTPSDSAITPHANTKILLNAQNEPNLITDLSGLNTVSNAGNNVAWSTMSPFTSKRVIYNANGGTGTMSNQMITVNSSTALTANSFTRAGYSFAGWNTDPDGTSGTSYSNQQAVTITTGFTLYAKWTDLAASVYFLADDYTAGSTTWTERIASAVGATATGGMTKGTSPTSVVFAGKESSNSDRLTGSIGSTTGLTAVTVEMWVRLGDNGSTQNAAGSMLFSWSASAGTANYNIYHNGSKLGFNAFASELYGINSSTHEQKWRHFVFVMSTGAVTTQKIYVNGVLQTLSYQLNTAMGTRAFNSSGDFVVMDNTSVTNAWNAKGNLGLLRVYRGELNSTQAASLYDATKSNYEFLAVTYDSQGGSSVSAGATSTGGSIATEPTAPTKTGYTFAGWSTTSNGSAVSFTGGYTHGQSADFTLYALWTADSLTVTYDSKSGTSVNNGSTTSGSSISAAPTAPTRTGYSLSGWSATDGGAVVTFPFTHGKTANFTMYAIWTPNTLTVAYDEQSGSSIADGTVLVGANISAAPIAPIRAGYSLTGWSTTSTGSVVSFPYSHGQTDNFTLYAIWAAISCSPTSATTGGYTVYTFTTAGTCFWTVPGGLTGVEVLAVAGGAGGGYSYDNSGAGGGAGGQVKTGTLTLSTTLEVTVGAGGAGGTTSSRRGSSGGNSVVSTITALGGTGGCGSRSSCTDSAQATSIAAANGGVGGGGGASGKGGGGSSSSESVTSSVTGGAGTASIYSGSSVTYGVGGAGGTARAALANIAGTAGSANTGNGGGGASAKSASGDVNGGAGGSGLVIVRVASTLTVAFNSQSGTSVSDTSTVTGGVISTAPTEPTRTNYTFLGWFTASTGGTAITFPYTHGQTTNFTLYAQWSLSTYAITFNANSGLGSMANQSVTHGVATNLNANLYSRANYVFHRWATAADGTGTTYNNLAQVTLTAGTTLYAQWTANTYVVTYSYNGGNGGDSTTTSSFTTGGTAITLPVPTKTGFTFAGWHSDSGLVNPLGLELDGKYKPTGATLTLNAYAKWSAVNYTFTYNANSAGSGTVPTETSKQITQTATVKANTGSLERAGYTFGGWNTQSNGTGDNYLSGSLFTVDAANVVLYAKWNANTYTVTYNVNGGSGNAKRSTTVVTSDSYTTGGTSVTLPDVGSLTRSGYTFAGWNTSAAGNGTNRLAGATYTTVSDVILYAEWTAVTYTITYNANSGTGSAPTSGGYTTGQASPYSVLTNTFTKASHVFGGWNTASNGTGTSYSPGSSITTLADIVLYAVWIPQFTLHYAINGGTVDAGSTLPPDALLTINTPVSVFSSLSRTGYTFNGWTNGASTIAPGGSFNIIEDSVLTAKWTAINYQVSYNSDGGTTPPTSFTKQIGQSYAIGNAPSKPGHDFLGWKTGSTIVGTGATIVMGSSDVSYTAQWAAQIYTISYDWNGGRGTAVSDVNYTFGTTAISLPLVGDRVKDGYTFAGWSESTNGSLLGATYTPSQTRTLYALWNIGNFTVTYNLSGGSLANTSVAVQNGSSTVLPLPTRANFVFDGWHSATTGGSSIGSNGASFTPNASQTVYARWIQASLYGITNSLTRIGSVTTVDNVGNTFSGANSSSSVAVSVPADALPAGTTINFDMVGNSSRARGLLPNVNYLISIAVSWIAGDGTVPNTASGKPISVTISNATIKTGATAYAIVNNVSTLLGTATQDGTITIELTSDPEVVVAAVKPTAPTNVAATSNGNQQSVISWSAPTSNGGSEITGYTVTSSPSVTTPAGCSGTTNLSCTFTGLSNGTAYTFTLTATNSVGTSVDSTSASGTTASVYAVTFDAKGGTSVTSGSFLTASTVSAPTAPTRTGYSFAGWSATDGGSAEVFPYAPGVTSAITMYARWDALDNAVTFDPKGGSDVTATIFSSGGTVAEPTAPTKSGYTFAGWSATDGGAVVTFPYAPGVVTDITLYAKWTVVSQNSSSGSGGGSSTPAPSEPSGPVNPVKSNVILVAPVTVIGDRDAKVIAVDIATPITGSGVNPLVIKVDKASEKFIAEVRVDEGKLVLTPETGFSGKKTVTVTITENGTDRIIQIPLTVLPEVVTKPVLTPASANKTIIRWTASPNADAYSVYLYGKKVCSTSATNCSVARVLGPDANVQIISNGGDRTISDKVEAEFKQTTPVAITRIVSATITKATLTKVDTKALDKVVGLIKTQGFGTVVISQITTTKKTQALAEARIAEIKKYIDAKSGSEEITFEIVAPASRTYFNNIALKG